MRSLLFTPGDDEKKLAKGLAGEADALIVDLEDSVAAARKPAARAIGAAFVAEARKAAQRKLLVVRINPLDGGLADLDLDAIVSAAPDAIMLPKSQGASSVQRLSAKLAVREAMAELADGAIGIIPIATETASALFGLATYANASPRLQGLAWGAEDLSADLGAEGNRGADGRYTSPFLLARDLALMAAVASGVAPIDTVFTNFRDAEGLRAECLAARRDGFVAKMAVHPAQVTIINEAFTPSPDAVARAEAIVAAFGAAPGAGVIGVDGEMFDLPHLKRARSLLARSGLLASTPAG